MFICLCNNLNTLFDRLIETCYFTLLRYRYTIILSFLSRYRSLIVKFIIDLYWCRNGRNNVDVTVKQERKNYGNVIFCSVYKYHVFWSLEYLFAIFFSIFLTLGNQSTILYFICVNKYHYFEMLCAKKFSYHKLIVINKSKFKKAFNLKTILFIFSHILLFLFIFMGKHSLAKTFKY